MFEVTLNLGAGEKPGPGINVDFRRLPGIQVVADVARLPFRGQTVDKLMGSDIIEHFPWADTTIVLNEWNRVLKQGGVAILKMPNMKTIAERYLKQEISSFEAQRLLYGGQTYPGNFHYAGFDPERFRGLAEHCGFKVVRVLEHPGPPDQNNMVFRLVKTYNG